MKLQRKKNIKSKQNIKSENNKKKSQKLSKPGVILTRFLITEDPMVRIAIQYYYMKNNSGNSYKILSIIQRLNKKSDPFELLS
jgi:hypothetical protein